MPDTTAASGRDEAIGSVEASESDEASGSAEDGGGGGGGVLVTLPMSPTMFTALSA